MNLVFRYTLLFVFVSLIVFIVGGMITYQVMKREIDAEQRRFLQERLSRTEAFIKRTKPQETVTRPKLSIRPLDIIVEDSQEFSDTVVMHTTLERLEPHLKIDAIRTIDGVSYKIVIFDIIVESDDISDVVNESLIKTYLILLGAFAILGLVASYYQLKPFHAILDIIKSFSVYGDPIKEFPKTSIKEFKLLSKFLDEMTRKVQKDYWSLKEFSENASHELQTPIAIIQSKLDVLMQDEKLNEDQLKSIESLQITTRRLSQLSSSLSLLTKIENQEFRNRVNVDLNRAFSSIMDGFQELLQIKGIKYELKKNEALTVSSDPVLIDILLTNLLNNAIKHNIEEGVIEVEISDNQFKISNSGDPLDIDPKKLFNRFRKSNQSNSSLGLGLAIVKEICTLYGFKVSYENNLKQHTVSVVFNL